MAFRIGYGYDVHQLAEGEEFWLGGIQIPHSHGAVGHSDADVVLHVICAPHQAPHAYVHQALAVNTPHQHRLIG